jgi:hypothetical protein
MPLVVFLPCIAEHNRLADDAIWSLSQKTLPRFVATMIHFVAHPAEHFKKQKKLHVFYKHFTALWTFVGLFYDFGLFLPSLPFFLVQLEGSYKSNPC